MNDDMKRPAVRVNCSMTWEDFVFMKECGESPTTIIREYLKKKRNEKP